MNLERCELERLKNAVPMETLLEALGFQPGKNDRTYCIFHGGDNPSSFKYDDDHVHCFACGFHGDKIDLMMRANQSTFEEAVEYLRQMAQGSGPALADAELGENTSLLQAIRRVGEAFDAVDETTEVDLRLRLEQNDEMLRRGKTRPCDYYTRRLLIDEEFEELDTNRNERKWVLKEMRRLVKGR